MSYLELAKRALEAPPAATGPVESVLRSGGRLTRREISALTGLTEPEVARDLASLTARGQAVAALDFHRRRWVWWWWESRSEGQ